MTDEWRLVLKEHRWSWHWQLIRVEGPRWEIAQGGVERTEEEAREAARQCRDSIEAGWAAGPPGEPF